MEAESRVGCPICKGGLIPVEGYGYECDGCLVFFNKRYFRVPSKRKEQIQVFDVFVTSKESRSYHVEGCKYARRIQNPITIDGDNLEGRRACVCVKGKAFKA